jgi:NADPH-dependent curcumin reductase CurA
VATKRSFSSIAKTLTPSTKFLPPPFSPTPISSALGATTDSLLDIGKPRSGETLVVSAATGGTGSIVGQLGKIHGCHLVGTAGSDEKSNWIKNDLGFAASVNYKHPDWKAQLAAATPKGVDINFENVGGEIMQAVLERMNLHGRVLLCGLISGYTKEGPALASFARVLLKRLCVEGFITLDYRIYGCRPGEWPAEHPKPSTCFSTAPASANSSSNSKAVQVLGGFF